MTVSHYGGSRTIATINVVSVSFGDPMMFYADQMTWRSFPQVLVSLKIIAEPSLKELHAPTNGIDLPTYDRNRSRSSFSVKEYQEPSLEGLVVQFVRKDATHERTRSLAECAAQAWEGSSDPDSPTPPRQEHTLPFQGFE